jgi:hypothetical protein
MAAKAEALAKQFDAKVQEATTVLERLTDADWKKTTASEKWTVGVVAHHLAGAHEAITTIMKTVAAGQTTNFTMDMLHDMNAKHAKEHGDATKAETIALHKKSAATAAAMLRGFSDADLAKSGVVLTGMPPMSGEQIVQAILLNHIEEHLKSIKATTGK